MTISVAEEEILRRQAIESIKKWDITLLATGLVSIQLNFLHNEDLSTQDENDLIEQWTAIVNQLIKNTRSMGTLEEHHAKRN